jgi:hypothetical protein
MSPPLRRGECRQSLAFLAARAFAIQSDPIEGVAKDAKFNLAGFKNVLKLRVESEGGTLAAPENITT